MIRDDPGFLPPYRWGRQPVFGLPVTGRGRRAVVVSWHVAPDFGTMPGQDRMLAIWAEPLLDALVEAGFETTLLIVGRGGDAAGFPLFHAMQRRQVQLELVEGADPLGTGLAVAAALERLAPDVVHAPERRGVLAAALARRAAGVAHLDQEMVLHARGPTLFQAEEQGRFIDDANMLLLDDLERQAMRLADRVLCCNPEVAGYLATGLGDARAAVRCEMVEPLVWPMPPVAAAPVTELVFPLPLGSEAGLEFAVAALARAGARKPLALPVTFLGQPDAVTIGNAATTLAGLAGAVADWKVLIAETPQRAVQYLARPGRVALLTSARATPPELLALCGAAGIPVLATTNAAVQQAAGRWPGIHALPRAERGFGATLARLPAMPAPTQAPPAPLFQPPILHDPASLGARAMAVLTAPDGAALTLMAPARPSLLAQLPAQSLKHFVTTLVLPPGVDAPTVATGPESRSVSIATAGLADALRRCETRYAVLCGDATRLLPHALETLLRAARATGAAAVTAWDNRSWPIGGGCDLVLLRQDSTLGHLVLLDLPALRERGGESLAAAGTPGFAAVLAKESGGVLMLPLELSEAALAPAPGVPPIEALLPPALHGAAALALHLVRPPPPDPLPPHASDMQRAMATANRDTTHYLKLIGRLFDSLGMEGAAADAWRARLARDRDDGETWVRHASLEFKALGNLSDIEGLRALVQRHGIGAVAGLPDVVAQRAQELLLEGKPDEAMALLHAVAPAFQDAPGYIAVLARAYARLARLGRPPTLPALSPAALAALRTALESHAVTLPAETEDDAA